jgi:tRNA threonylcarbamoyladenosine biosynthesis protein TsaB
MNILSFDTTLNRCSVAVLAAGQVLAHKYQALQRGHAEALMPMISDALLTADLTFSDLDLIAVTTGPGTFTGQRVGLSAARGIAVARGLPVQGVGSLPAIAHAARNDADENLQDPDILVVLDARRGQFYAQLFPADQAIYPAANLPVAIATNDLADLLTLKSCVLVGTGAQLAMEMPGLNKSEVRAISSSPEADAVGVAQLATLMVARDGLPTAPPAPLYLRAPDAKLPGGRTL